MHVPMERGRLERRWARLRDVGRDRPMLFDLGVVIVLAVLGLLAISMFPSQTLEEHDAVGHEAAYALLLALVVPLTWRRRYPLTVLAVVTAAYLAFTLSHVPEGTVSSVVLFLSIYSAGAYGDARRRTWARALSISIMTVLVLWMLFVDDQIRQAEVSVILLQVFAVVLNLFFFLTAWLFGDTIRQRHERERELEQRTVELQHERAENARRAVLDERVRIARELHDVVAHHVSVMGVQAGAARRVLDRQPDRVADVLSSIEGSSRQAVAELHRLLGFLRQEDDHDDLAPPPTLGQLDALVRSMGTDAMDVDLVYEGEARPLPPSVDLSAYRVVQEALTNALKHAGPASVCVVVRYRADALEVEVTDDGFGAAAAPIGDGNGSDGGGSGGGGHGLAGMRERVALHGGRLRTGHRRTGGFLVRAEFPLQPALASR